MKIDSSHFSLAAFSTASERITQVRAPLRPVVPPGNSIHEARPKTTAESPAASQDTTEVLDSRLVQLIRLVEDLTGRPVHYFRGNLQSSRGAAAESFSNTAPPPVTSQQASIEEQSSLVFSAEGKITTSTGEELEISLQFSIEHYYRADVLPPTESRPAKDPLLLNLGEGSVSISGQNVSIDLNGDGSDESIPMPGTGGTYLVLDRDGNQAVTTEELIGAKSGRAFADLAQLDTDKNGWIDENEPSFARLRVWMQSDNGRLLLKSLKEAGIGALYVQAAQTPFNIKDNQNNTMAIIQQTGLFLKENGQAFNMHQIDLLA